MDKEDKYRREFYLKTFLRKFLNYPEPPKQEDIDYYIQRTKEMESLTYESKRFYMLLDHTTFSPVYLSKNTELESGYSNDYIINVGVKLLFKLIHWRQLTAIFQLHIWGPKAKEILKTADDDKTSATFCGLKLKDKSGNWRTFILTQKMLTFDINGDVILSFITAEEITYFHKSFVVWYRVKGNCDVGPGTRVFFLNGTKKEAVDLFTKRELDILICAASKMSIQEIAEQLELSKNTIERHRKNMIAKVGVTNMTGVIRISQILNLV